MLFMQLHAIYATAYYYAIKHGEAAIIVLLYNYILFNNPKDRYTNKKMHLKMILLKNRPWLRSALVTVQVSRSPCLRVHSLPSVVFSFCAVPCGCLHACQISQRE
jgi:hypothetical protein